MITEKLKQDTRYFKNETDYPMLCQFKEKYAIFKKEYADFCNDPVANGSLENMSTATKAIKSSKSDWKVFSFVMHNRTTADIVKEHKLSFNGKTTEQLLEFFSYVEKRHFPETQKFLSEMFKNPDNGLVSVWFSQFNPGTKLGMHTNYDPYMYRAHLGIDVPEGNIGFKVCDETIKWKNGEILVFDPINPHTAWNLTEQIRTVLIIDFFRPEKDRNEMIKLEKEQYELMMKKNPNSFGMSGGMFDLDPEILKKYSVPEVESGNTIRSE